MKWLYNTYNRYLIAVLLMTIMYGRPLVCAVYKIVTIQAMKAVPDEELSTEDNENEGAKESTVKDGKKSMIAIAPCLALPSTHTVPINHNALWPLIHIDLIESFYQKVPTPPPLLHKA